MEQDKYETEIKAIRSFIIVLGEGQKDLEKLKDFLTKEAYDFLRDEMIKLAKLQYIEDLKKKEI